MQRVLCLSLFALAIGLTGRSLQAQAPCGPDFFSENFDAVADDAALATAGWQIIQANGAVENAQWTITNPCGRRNPPAANGTASGGRFIISDSDCADGSNTIGTGMSHDLVTPSFSTAGGTVVWLYASCNAQLNNAADAVFDVDVSTDGGTSFTNAFRRVSPGARVGVPPVPDNSNADGFFGQLAVDLSTLASNKADVRLRFRHFEPTDDWWVALDDIRVTCEAPPSPGNCTVLAKQDFAAGLGAMTAVSLLGNVGCETWCTADKGLRYVAGTTSGRGVNRINHPNAAKEFAIMESEANPDPVEDEYLQTPVLNCSGFSNVLLSYKSETVLADAALQEVLLSLDGGATFPARIFKYNEPGAGDNGLFDDGEDSFYAERIFSLPQAAGESKVVIAFHYKGPGNSRFWALDDVEVTGVADVCDPRDCGLRNFSVSYDAASNKVNGSWGLLPGDAAFRVLQGARVVADLPGTATSFVDSTPPAGGMGVTYTLECYTAELTPGGRSGWTKTDFTYCYEANPGEALYAGNTDNILGNLDGSWRRSNNSDEWDGSGSTPGAGAPGGLDIDAIPDGEGGTSSSALSLEDVGDPRGAGFPDPGNRKLYLWRDTTSELDLASGVTLVARWRLLAAPKSAEFANNGGPLPVPNGSSLHDSNKGQIGFIQKTAAGGTVTANLSFAITDAGLLEFAANAACGAGPAQTCFEVDETTWVSVWMTAIEEAGGVRLKVYLNGSFTPALDATLSGIAASAEDVPLPEAGGNARSYIAIGLGSTGQNGAIQVDYVCAAGGVNDPVNLTKDRDCVSSDVTTFVCPSGLAARASQTAKTVKLTWTPGINLDGAGYELSRNGAVIATLGLGDSTYTDTPPLPSKGFGVYNYSLAVVGGSAGCGALSARAILSSGAVCFADDFEDYPTNVDFELAGWFLVDEGPGPGEPGATWTTTNPGGRSNPPTFDGKASSGRFAISDSDFADGDNGAPGNGNSNDLWSPEFSCPEGKPAWLHMDTSAQLNNNGKVVFDVDVSTDGGGSWTNVYRRVAPARTEAPPLADRTNADGFFGRLDIDLTAQVAGKPGARFRLRSFEPSDDWWIAVDNVVIDDQPPPAGGDVVVFEEDFEAGITQMGAVSLAVPPNTGDKTWTANDVCLRHNGAVQERGANRIDKVFAILDSECDPDPAEDEYLVTPELDCSKLAEVILQYDSEIVADEGAIQEVLVSLDGGNSFLPDPVFSYNGGGLFDSAEEPFFARRAFSVPQAAGQANVLFAFHYRSPGNRRFWILDNVRVTGTSICKDPFAVSIDGASEGTSGTTADYAAGTDATGPATYAWAVISGPASIPGSSSAALVTLNLDAAGEVVLEVTVTDGCGKKGKATKTITVVPAGGRQKPNDENQDGKMDLSDAVAVLNYLFTGTNPSLACADGSKEHPSNIALLDSNGDGKIDLSDPVRLLGFLLLGQARPASCIDDSCPCIVIPLCPDLCP